MVVSGEWTGDESGTNVHSHYRDLSGELREAHSLPKCDCPERLAAEYLPQVRRQLKPVGETRPSDFDDWDLIPLDTDIEDILDLAYPTEDSLLRQAVAHLAKCRFVVLSRRGKIMDTDVLVHGDTIIFDRNAQDVRNGF